MSSAGRITNLTGLLALVITASLAPASSFSAELLVTHDRWAIPEGSEGRWMALCESDAGIALVEVELTIERSVEAHPGPTVHLAGCGSAVALVRGGTMEPGPIPTAFRGAKELPAGTSTDIPWNGDVLRVVVPATQDFQPPRITLDQGSIHQQVAAGQYGGTPKLLWAGDLDGDGELDLLFVTELAEWSDHQLFTSRGRRKGSLVKLAAHFAISGC